MNESNRQAQPGPGVPRIRPLVDVERGAILRINNANVPAVGALDEQSLKSLLALASVTLVVASPEAPDHVAGFCILLDPGTTYASENYRWFDARYGDFWYLDRVAIDEPFRNRGLGGLLYAEVERRARAPMIALEVNVRPRNEGSLRFHRRQGFVEVGQQETGHGVRVSLQVKRLRPVPNDHGDPGVDNRRP